jgi:hypothetical protein
MRRRSRKAFLIIWGWRAVETRENKKAVIGPCPSCRTPDAPMHGRMRRRWFTLFFIPVLPVDRPADAERFTRCGKCKAAFDRTIEQFARQFGATRETVFTDTIRVYNDLRDNPADGQIMLKLLRMYEELNEPREAEGVARHFPLAMTAEPECEKVLQRIRRRDGLS